MDHITNEKAHVNYILMESVGFMKKAIEYAHIGFKKEEVPIGAVFVYKGEEIAGAHNLTCSTSNAILHCEILCIRKIQNDWNSAITHGAKALEELFHNTVLYVTCEPCIMCAEAIGLLGIKQVFYGCENSKFGGNGSILSIHDKYKYTSVSGVMKAECYDILKQFFEKENMRKPKEPESKRKKI